MSTVSEAVISWLGGYPGIGNLETVNTDQVDPEATSLGLLKAPGTRYQSFVDGSRDVISYYIFRARRPSQENDFRVESQEFLEDLERWVWQQNMLRNLPVLSTGACYAVQIDQASYLLEVTDTGDSVYQLGIEVSYSEPKPEAPATPEPNPA